MGVYAKVRRGVWAAYCLVAFTLLGSICMGVGFGLVYQVTGTLSYEAISSFEHPNSEAHTFIIGMILFGFLTKLPCWPVCYWLSVAHVEVNTEGSVMLAALFLKVGLVGLVRFLIIPFQGGLCFYQPLITVWVA